MFWSTCMQTLSDLHLKSVFRCFLQSWNVLQHYFISCRRCLYKAINQCYYSCVCMHMYKPLPLNHFLSNGETIHLQKKKATRYYCWSYLTKVIHVMMYLYISSVQHQAVPQSPPSPQAVISVWLLLVPICHSPIEYHKDFTSTQKIILLPPYNSLLV